MVIVLDIAQPSVLSEVRSSFFFADLSVRFYFTIYSHYLLFTLQNYLTKYGYLTPEDKYSGSLRSQEIVKDAVKNFQRMAGLNMTGIVIGQ